jgi:tRNA threonylcarbamoyladenosine biosynthesis protein TsaE
MKKEILIEKMSDWSELALEVLNLLEINNSGATVITLTGDLGVGKTTFVQTLAKTVGINETVTSPTFTIVKGYQPNPEFGFFSFIHMDAYRIDDLSELNPLRFSEILNQPKTLICVEWAEKIAAALPKNTLSLVIKHTVGEQRKVEISL